MAESLAVIGLVAAITQFTNYGYKVVKRLDEFTSATIEVPECFRSIQSRLPLVIETLKHVQVQAGTGRVSETAGQALKPVVDSSLVHAQELTSIIDKAVPLGKFSTFERRLQALKSLAYDRRMQKILDQLQSDIHILIFYQSTTHSDISDEIKHELSRLSLAPIALPSNYAFGLDLGAAPQIEEGAFVGREVELRQLCEWLIPPGQSVVAVSGMGGVGKTQLSVAFTKLNRGAYTSLFWLNAKDEVGLKQDLVTLSQRLFEQSQQSSVGSHVDEDQVVEQVRQWFSRADNDQWLILFDNYDNPRIPGAKSATGYDIRRYFPYRSHGSILITTRSRRLTFAKQLKLHKLEDIDQSIAILSQRSGRDLKKDLNAVKLAKRLDGLPLALATAGTYLGQTTTSVDEYLDAYEGHWHELSHNAEELLEYEDRTLFSTWTLSLNQIRDQDPEAAEFLGLLAYFGNQGICYELVRTGAIHGLAWLNTLTETKSRFNRAMARLYDYSLVEITTGGYSLHTCVHDWTLQALNREVSAQHYWIAVGCIVSHVKMKSDREYWEVNRRLVCHALRLRHSHLAQVCDSGTLDESNCDSLYILGLLLSDQEKMLEAEYMYQRALTGYEKALGPYHKSTLDIFHSLGELYRAQGRMVEAEQMYQRALIGREKIFGPDHPSTLDTINYFGLLCRDQGKIIKAEQMFQRALAGREKAMGSDHTSTLNTVHNLGLIYSDQGKITEAEKMYQRALTGREKALGAEHPWTFATLNNFGILYRDQGKMVEAEQVYRRALAGCEQTLGPDHTWTLNTVHNLGMLYRDQGEITAAEQMYRRALAGCEKALGLDHISTLTTVNNLGALYHDQGRVVKAEEMYQRALAGYEKALEPDHKLILNTINNLGSLYRDQGKLDETEQMYQRAVTGYEKALESDHTWTLNNINNPGAL